MNCLTLGLGEKCCGGVVETPECYCEVDRYAYVRPGKNQPEVRVSELGLSCLKNLKCKR